MIDPESPDVRVAVLGRQVEMFLEGDVGTYIAQCCYTEVEEATEKLKRVDATDFKAVQELQNRIWRAESVMGWLGDAIRAGSQAKENLQETQ